MSKLTSQEVIDEGAYLEPGFKPAGLLVPHLRAILQNHNVPYPATASKAQLINLFNENIVPNANKFKKERRTAAAIPSDASDIMDGQTGAFLESKPAGRRLTRQSSGMASARVPSASPTRKSRRSAITPRASMKSARGDTSEEESDARVQNGAPTTADRQRRRISQKWGKGDDTSLWEDNNPFQRASLTPEKEVADLKPRKSRTGRPSSLYEPPQPQQQIFPMAGSLQLPPPPRASPRSSYDEYNPALSQSTPGKFETSYAGVSDETMDESPVDPEGEELDYNNVISQKIASLGTGEAGALAPISRSSGPSTWVRVFLSILMVMGTGVLWTYKEDSASLGYCDAGKNTNFKVLQALEDINKAEECKRRLIEQTEAGVRPDASLESCKTSFIPRATYCTPCPAHASCSIHFVTCEPAYRPHHHALSSIPMLDRALDGLPGLGPVALPAECVPDARRRHHVGKMGRLIEGKLARTRGQRICDGVESAGGDAQDADAYGERTEDIRVELKKKYGKAIYNFDEIFEQAISELKSNGLLVSVRDITGHEHLASIRQEDSYYCQAKLMTLKTWKTWQRTVLATLFAGLLILAARSRLTKSALERRRVRGLVKDVLERVRAQEARHYLDPVGYPSSVLSSLQLRDEVMADEHSIVTRQRLWQQVEKIVEENSNVRSNMEVMPTGDEGRVWTWIGSGNRRIDFGDDIGRKVL